MTHAYCRDPLITRSTASKDGFVVLEIGPQKQRYHLHKALLTHHSEYFNNALNGPWKEAEDKIVTLEDVDTIAVDIFVHWLYTQQIPDNDATLSMSVSFRDPKDDDHPISGYTKALVFGDRFLVPVFRQAVHNCIVDTLLYDEDGCPRDPTCFAATKYAYENLPSDHSILKLFLDYHCRHWDVTVDDEENGIAALIRTDLPPTLLIRMVARYSSRAANADKNWWDADLRGCDYHVHLDEQERADCKRKLQKAGQAT